MAALMAGAAVLSALVLPRLPALAVKPPPARNDLLGLCRRAGRGGGGRAG